MGMNSPQPQIRKIIIPSAGAGTRMLPISKAIPKEMLNLANKPVCQYLVEEAYEAGIREFIFIINPWKGIIKTYFADAEGNSALETMADARFSFIETDDRFGDGHAISLASPYIETGESFAVTMGDLLSPPGTSFVKQLVGVFAKDGYPVISTEQVPQEHVDRYGIVSPRASRGRVHEIADIVEKPPVHAAASTIAMTGKYVLTSEIFSYLKDLLAERKDGQEVRLADALKKYAREKTLLALECEGKHIDTGNKAGLIKAQIIFGLGDKSVQNEIKIFLQGLN